MFHRVIGWSVKYQCYSMYDIKYTTAINTKYNIVNIHNFEMEQLREFGIFYYSKVTAACQ